MIALHRKPGFRPSLGARIARVATEYGVDIIHCHHYSPFVYGSIAAIVNGRLKLVFTEHGRLSDAPPTLKRKIATAVVGRMPAAMFAVSSNLKAHMVAEGFPARRLGVIHNGIDAGPAPTPAGRVAARRLMGIGDDACLIGTAARLHPVKDLPTLVAAMAGLRTRAPMAQLIIVGGGPEEAALEEVIRQTGSAEVVRLLGHRSDVRALMPGFDVYVNSSISEGISLTILEAMAAGVPVVATRVGGTPEVVVDGTTGLLVDARNSEALAVALAALAHDPVRRRALGDAGRQRLTESFTIERMVTDYGREYTRSRRN